MSSGFRNKIREIARRRAKGLPPVPVKYSNPDPVDISDIWQVERRADIFFASPDWSDCVPYPSPPYPDLQSVYPIGAYDIETLGLGGLPIFLIGLAIIHTDRIELRQYFIEHISNEPAMLKALFADFADVKSVVTYNGASFDLPYTNERANVHLIEWDGFPQHFDMLHTARRCYKGRVDNFKLPTVEMGLLGFDRGDDVPSAEVSRMFQIFSESGDGRPLLGVLEHNLYDIISTALLALKIGAEFPQEFAVAPEYDCEHTKYPLFD